MSVHGPLLRQAAQALAGSQTYPAGALYVVATPIGNLADIGLRALQVLSLVDAVACEDTRHTGALLQAYGLSRPLIALHQHNEAQAAEDVLRRLREGERIALASDAGTPGISDPGARLCAAVHAAGLRALPVPGASSVTALVSVAGLAEAGEHSAFEFAGFLPAKGALRQARLRELADRPHAVVLLEAPHRISALAQDLQALGARRLTVGRELTKQFEEVDTVACADLPGWLAAQPARLRGEFALVLHPNTASDAATGTGEADEGVPAPALRVLDLLLAELPLKTAARLAAQISGASRKALYQAALRRRGPEGDSRGPHRDGDGDADEDGKAADQ